MELTVVILGSLGILMICIDMYFYAKEKDESNPVLFRIQTSQFPAYLTEEEAQKRYKEDATAFFLKRVGYYALGGSEGEPQYMSFFSWLIVRNYRIA